METNIMEKIYYTPDNTGSFGGVNRLRKKKNKRNIKEWLSYQDAYTLHKHHKRKFLRRKTFVGGIDLQWQSDLFDITSISKVNKGFKFILICIDILTRYAWAVPIRDKSGNSVVSALKQIIDSSGRKCHILQIDKGAEYYNRSVSRYLKKKGIRHFSTENDDIKASIAERFIRTLKERIWRYFTYKKNKKFINDLPLFMESYNNSVHSTTHLAPSKVTKNDELYLLQQMYDTPRREIKQKFFVGQTVRISMTKRPFKKGYESKWTEEIFNVSAIKHTNPITYKLHDLQGDPIKGLFYTEELQRVRIHPDHTYRVESIIKTRRRNKKTEYYVKWFGFPEKFNSWIQKEDIKE